MIQHIKNCIVTIIFLGGFSLPALAQAPASTQMSSTQIFLLTIAIILLIPIYIMGRAFMASVKIYHETKKDTQSSSGTLPLILMLLSVFLYTAAGAQDATAVAETAVPSKPIDWGTVILFITIVTELLVILYLSTVSLKFINGARMKDEPVKAEVAKQPSAISRWWKKVNNFKSAGEAEAMDTGHNYDGIRELDNNIPAWFTAAFVVCIIFAIVYLMRYHVFNSAPLMIEEYTIAMAEAEKEREAYLEKNANAIDEKNVKMLGADDIASGKILYDKNCAVCHLADGGGATGPNLTDVYWIHGGGISDVFKSIKYGWPDKGMIAWKDNFSAKQLAQLTSFIKSLQGTKPATPKEPQGEIYNETPVSDTTMVAPADTTNTTIKDSAALASR